MRMLFLFILSCFFLLHTNAQTDSLAVKKNPSLTSAQYDSLYMAKRNNSGNLMIAGGVGLCGASAYLIYQGLKIYRNPEDKTKADYSARIQQNHSQGTIYLAAAGVGVAVAAVLLGLGIRNKVEFKNHKKMLEMQSGLLNNGNLGLALNF